MAAEVVVVGGGYAGVLAAQRLARRAAGRARVTLISEQAELVHRIRLHEVAAGSVPQRRALAALVAGTGAEVRVARVEAIDTARRELVLGCGERQRADFVLLATGSATDVDTIPGAATYAHRLDGLGHTAALAAAVARGGALVVAGGGPTAVEAAAELAERVAGLRVTLVAPALLPGFSAAAHAQVRRAFARLGIELVEGTRVLAVEPGAVLTDTAGRLAADTTLVAAGFAPAALARASGLPVDERGRLLVDATMRAVGVPWLLGAGDAATTVEPVGATLEMSCKCAMPMGATAADTVVAVLAGQTPRALAWGDTGVGISLGRRDAMVQARRRDGANRFVLSGRVAAFTKEVIARWVTLALTLSRRIDHGYAWPSAPRQLPAPAPTVAGS